MARLDAGLTQGLMNPTYQKELGQVGGMLGGMGGHMRQTRRDKEEAQNMAGMTSEQLMARQREIAGTPAEALAAQQAQQTQAQGAEDREFLVSERKQQARERKQKQAESYATSQLSAMGIKHKALVKAGKTEEADKLLGEMEEIAEGAMVKLSDFVEDVDSSRRYINVGEGKLFDTFTGKYVTDPTEAQKNAAGKQPSTKDFMDTLQKNKEQYKPEAFQQFLADIAKKGIFKSAEEHLFTEKGMVDFKKGEAQQSADVVADLTIVMDNIDEMLAIAPDMSGGTISNMASGVGQQVGSIFAGTDAQDLENKVDSLRANTAFDRLQKMRDNSKTGGALGQVSEKELKLLQDNLGALDPSTKSFSETLMIVRTAYERALDIEQGPEGGSARYQKDDQGSWLYIDPVNKIIYDYASGDPDPRFN